MATTLTIPAGNLSASAVFRSTAAGAGTLGGTNGAGLTGPSAVSYTAAAVIVVAATTTIARHGYMRRLGIR